MPRLLWEVGGERSGDTSAALNYGTPSGAVDRSAAMTALFTVKI
jgi:hypothetical protein